MPSWNTSSVVMRVWNAMDERMAVSMALDDAKARGTEYLSDFFGLAGAVVVKVDDIHISYDDDTGYTSADLMLTVRAEG